MDTLPIELRIKIVRYLDIEVLLSLEYRDEIMWEILRNPTLVKTKTWLVEYVSKFGIIYIRDGTDFAMYNHNYYEDDKELYDEQFIKKTKHINAWDSRLSRGFYKLRFLVQGFDLVKIGNYFLSSQDGLLESFNELKDNEWGTSYKSRGFELVTEVDERLSPGLYNLSSGIRPISNPKIIVEDKKATFYIVYPYKRFLFSYEIELILINYYSTDNIYNGGKSGHIPIIAYILKDIKSKKIIGYKLQTQFWSAYDVTDCSYSNNGYYEFSVSWYRYLNKEKCSHCGHIPSNPLIGFIITGSQNEYIYPGTIEDSDFKYPDKPDSIEDED